MRGGLAVVIAGGDAPTPADIADLPPFEHVIAADSGLDHARALGLPVDVVVGDLDSVRPETLAAARAEGVEVQDHPSDKDQSDLELALDVAIGREVASIVVVGTGGGRFDQLLGNISLLASPAYAAIEVEARSGGNRVAVVRSRARSFRGRPGDLITLMAVHGPARGVLTEGLRWPLVNETLEAGSSRGLSNEFAAEWAWVTVGEGTVVALQPAAEASG